MNWCPGARTRGCCLGTGQSRPDGLVPFCPALAVVPDWVSLEAIPIFLHRSSPSGDTSAAEALPSPWVCHTRGSKIFVVSAEQRAISHRSLHKGFHYGVCGGRVLPRYAYAVKATLAVVSTPACPVASRGMLAMFGAQRYRNGQTAHDALPTSDRQHRRKSAFLLVQIKRRRETILDLSSTEDSRLAQPPETA